MMVAIRIPRMTALSRYHWLYQRMKMVKRGPRSLYHPDIIYDIIYVIIPQDKLSLIKHEQSHLAGEMRTHSCDICHKCFTSATWSESAQDNKVPGPNERYTGHRWSIRSSLCDLAGSHESRRWMDCHWTFLRLLCTYDKNGWWSCQIYRLETCEFLMIKSFAKYLKFLFNKKNL